MRLLTLLCALAASLHCAGLPRPHTARPPPAVPPGYRRLSSDVFVPAESLPAKFDPQAWLGYRWPSVSRGIAYQIASAFTTEERSVIRDALDHLQDQLCLSFSSRTPSSGQPLLQFQKSPSENSCFTLLASIGDIYRQDTIVISLSRDCLTLGNAAHEVLHALGIIHEHQRPDRDNFVLFVGSQYGDANNFKAYDPKLVIMARHYDYSSIMHYKVGFEAPLAIGQNQGLSQGDLDLLSWVYGGCRVPRQGGVTTLFQAAPSAGGGFGTSVRCLHDAPPAGAFVAVGTLLTVRFWAYMDGPGACSVITSSLPIGASASLPTGQSLSTPGAVTVQFNPPSSLKGSTIALGLSFTDGTTQATCSVPVTVVGARATFDCFGVPADDPYVCSGHGRCFAQDMCVCTSPYDGHACSCGSNSARRCSCTGQVLNGKGGYCKQWDSMCSSGGSWCFVDSACASAKRYSYLSWTYYYSCDACSSGVPCQASDEQVPYQGFRDTDLAGLRYPAALVGSLDVIEDYELDFVEANVAQFEVTYIGVPLELGAPTVVRADFADASGQVIWRYRADIYDDWRAYSLSGDRSRFGMLPGLTTGSARLPKKGTIRIQAQNARWFYGDGQPSVAGAYQGVDNTSFGSYHPSRLLLRLQGIVHCRDGYWGPHCENLCPGGAGLAQCGGNGLCRDGAFGNGQCQCFSLWDPDTNCTTCIEGFAGYDCQLRVGGAAQVVRYTFRPARPLVSQPVTMVLEGWNLPQPPATGDLVKVVRKTNAAPAKDCATGVMASPTVVAAQYAAPPGSPPTPASNATWVARQATVVIPFEAASGELLVCYSEDGTDFDPIFPLGLPLFAADDNECTNGQSRCSPDAVCINTAGSYSCVCKSGLAGDGFECYVPGCIADGSSCMLWNESLGGWPGTSCATTRDYGALYPWCVQACRNGQCTIVQCRTCSSGWFSFSMLTIIWIVVGVVLCICCASSTFVYRKRHRQAQRHGLGETPGAFAAPSAAPMTSAAGHRPPEPVQGLPLAMADSNGVEMVAGAYLAAQPAPAVGGWPLQTGADPAAAAQLQEMGFPEEDVRAALICQPALTPPQ